MLASTCAAAAQGQLEVVITTYERLVLRRELLSSVPWHVAIFDECHKLKNAKVWGGAGCGGKRAEGGRGYGPSRGRALKRQGPRLRGVGVFKGQGRGLRGQGRALGVCSRGTCTVHSFALLQPISPIHWPVHAHLMLST